MERTIKINEILANCWIQRFRDCLYTLQLSEDICKLKDTLDNVLKRLDLQE